MVARLTSSSGNEGLMKIWPLLIGIGCLIATSSTQAGPPFVTDDPEPPPPGGWEINVPLIVERTPGKTEVDAPLFDLNYGLPDIQLKLEIPVRIVNEDDGGTVAGAGDLLLGVKWRFFNNEKSQIQLGIYPQLLLPTGDQSRGLGEGRTAFVLPLVTQKSWDKWTIYGNVGYWWRPAAETRNYVYAGAVLEREINQWLTLGVELFGNSPKERGGRSDIAFNVGGTWKLSQHLNLLFAGGRDIVGDTHAMAYIGLQLLTK
jgi:Putative MetA-pathway of phenol degradation